MKEKKLLMGNKVIDVIVLVMAGTSLAGLVGILIFVFAGYPIICQNFHQNILILKRLS